MRRTRSGGCAFLLSFQVAFLSVSCLSYSAEWFVSPDGQPDNAGTQQSPWDLASALSGTKPIGAGDTLWVRGGIYRNAKSEFVCRLSGTEKEPVIVRRWRNERATIDGALLVEGQDTWLWGLEVTVSMPRPDVPMPAGSHPVEMKRPAGGFHSSKSVRCKVINCIVHDTHQAFSWWVGALDSEIYGCILYQNGWVGVDRTHGHAIYTQNDKGTKRIVDNIMFDPYNYTLHAYGSSRAYVNGYHVEGNIFAGGTVLIGGGRPSERIAFFNNCTYKAATQFGYNAPHNEDVICRGNYFASGLAVNKFRRFEVSGNEFVAGARGSVTPLPAAERGEHHWNSNRYVLPSPRVLDSWREKNGFDRDSVIVEAKEGRPSENKIIVRPNQYEASRANVAVYNWEGKPAVELDLAPFLKHGQTYAIYNVQDLFGKPVAVGRFDGKPIRIPLLCGARRTDLRLAGDPTRRVWDVFGDYPDFDMFVVQPAE